MRAHLDEQIAAWRKRRRAIRARITDLEKELVEARSEDASAALRSRMLDQLGTFMVRGERNLERSLRRQAASAAEAKRAAEQEAAAEEEEGEEIPDISDNPGGEDAPQD